MGFKTTIHSGQLLIAELNTGAIPGISEPIKTGGKLFLALHSDDPGANGSQEAAEVRYVNYARVGIARDRFNRKWTINGGKATNVELISFPICQGGMVTAKFWSLGTDSKGPGKLLRRGKIIDPKDGFSISNNITPQAPPNTLTIEEN